MKQQQGFTLIELIIVIVILGILAVTAAPRFIDIQSDARSETLQGVKAAVQGASQLVYAKAAIAGVQNNASTTVTINSQTVGTTFGYPDADQITTAALLQRFVDIELDGDLTFENDASTDDVFVIRYSAIAADLDAATGCYIQYTNPTAQGATPTFTVVTTAC